MPGVKRSASRTPSPTNNMDCDDEYPQSEHSATPEYDPSPEPDIKPRIKSKGKAPAEGKVKVKAEPKQTTPRKTLKTSAEAASPTGATGADGRRLLVKAVIERGIASAMADSKVVMVETGLTSKQIQNYIGKGRSLRKALEDAAKTI